MGRKRGCGRFLTAAFLACLLHPPIVAAAADTYHVALMSFAGSHGMVSEQSQVITGLLASNLAADPRIRLVEQDRLGPALSELGLNLTDIVDPGQAVGIGSKTGAGILVMGRLTYLGMKNALFARVMGAKTSRVETLVVSAPRLDPVSVLVDDLAEKIVGTLVARGPFLVGAPGEEDPDLEALRERLEGRSLPSLALSAKEIFGGVAREQSAVETELLRILTGVGFEVYEQSPPEADVVVTALALGEFASRRGGLVSSSVELKLKAVSSKEKKVLAAAKARHTVADLTDQAAASRAFRESAAALAPDLIISIVEKWSEQEARLLRNPASGN